MDRELLPCIWRARGGMNSLQAVRGGRPRDGGPSCPPWSDTSRSTSSPAAQANGGGLHTQSCKRWVPSRRYRTNADGGGDAAGVFVFENANGSLDVVPLGVGLIRKLVRFRFHLCVCPRGGFNTRTYTRRFHQTGGRYAVHRREICCRRAVPKAVEQG